MWERKLEGKGEYSVPRQAGRKEARKERGENYTPDSRLEAV